MSQRAAGLRIWYQSFTDQNETRRYHDRLLEHVNAVARQGNSVEVVGMDPASRKHRITELRCGVEVVRNAIRAEREGYDAFILGHFQDTGLWEARSAVEIPVIGLGESAMLHACTLGQTIGLVTIHSLFISVHREQIRRYGLEHRIVATVAVDSSAADYVRAFSDPEVAKALAEEYGRKIALLLEQGCEVVLPAGGLPSLLFGADLKLSAGSACVLDSTAVAVKSAEMAVDLRRFNGTAPSRVGAFIPPTDAALAAIGMPRLADAPRR
ncbi:MAG: aspartate/glutamate racemase family protein [Betaproteobacteria bacterium]